jgi:hypothetical protein
MTPEASHQLPDIVPCLVLPFEKTCRQDGQRYAALVFAQRGRLVLFAAEADRKFGVGILDGAGEVSDSHQYPSFDRAADAFLTAVVAGDRT